MLLHQRTAGVTDFVIFYPLLTYALVELSNINLCRITQMQDQ